jgi:hypothetical protein
MGGPIGSAVITTPGGGVAIVADSEEAARELAASFVADEWYRDRGPQIQLSADEWASRVVYRLDGFCEPRVFVFPDAGCC